MPPKKRKPSVPKDDTKATQAASAPGTRPDDVPNDVWEVLNQAIQEALLEYESKSAVAASESIDAAVQRFQDAVDETVPHLDRAEIRSCFASPGRALSPRTTNKATTRKRPSTRMDTTIQAALTDLVTRAHRQTMRAYAVFDLLDADGKGCVVVQDVQRANLELDHPQQIIPDADLHDMMQLLRSSDDAGLLSRHDLVRLARLVNL